MKSFLIACFVCGILSVAQGCPSKFKSSSEDEYKNATKSCAAMLSISTEDMQKHDEIIHNADLDDKCMTKCVLQKLEVVDKNGMLDRDVFFDFLEESAPKHLLTKLTEIVNKCADSTEIDKMKSKDVEAKTQAPVDIPCQTYHAFDVCFMVNAEKLC